MGIKTMACISAFALFTPAANGASGGGESDILACLRKNIAISAVDFGPSAIDNRRIAIEITNNTDIPLGGVWITFEIWSADRPLPLYMGSIREAATIPGALMPGESIISQDAHFMDKRSKMLARSASELRLEIRVENAADDLMNGLLAHPRMGSWSNAISSLQCGRRES